jgi:hypothetical protein
MNPNNLNQVVTQQNTQPAAHQDNNQKLLSPFMSIAAFESGQRMAKALASSDLVPQQFRNNVGNTLLALEMANRLEMPVFSVLQNIYIVHGKPSFSAAFLIAVVNSSKRFDTPILFRFNDARTECYAYAKKGELEIRGTTVSIEMAKKEGWWSKKDRYGNETSKWQSMPELMLQYRAATFFVRMYASDLALGVKSSEELEDTIEAEIVSTKPAPAKSLNDVVAQENACGEAEQADKDARLESLKGQATRLGIKFRSDITYPTLFKRVSDHLDMLEAKQEAEERAAAEQAAAEQAAAAERGEPVNEPGDSAGAVPAGQADGMANTETKNPIAWAYSRLIAHGLKRSDLNDFCAKLNLNAANIDGFMADVAGVEAQIERYYATKGE